MKETSITETDKIENVKSVQQEKQLKFVGSGKKQKGLTLWEFNRVTLEICKADIEALPAQPFKQAPIIPKGIHPLDRLRLLASNQNHVAKMIGKENCDYVWALRIESAVKKFGLNIKVVKRKTVKP